MSGQSVAVDPSGNNVYLTGYFSGGIRPTVDFVDCSSYGCILVILLDTAGGSVEWGLSFGGSDGSIAYGRSLALDSSGNLYLTGYYQGEIYFGSPPSLLPAFKTYSWPSWIRWIPPLSVWCTPTVMGAFQALPSWRAFCFGLLWQLQVAPDGLFHSKYTLCRLHLSRWHWPPRRLRHQAGFIGHCPVGE